MTETPFSTWICLGPLILVGVGLINTICDTFGNRNPHKNWRVFLFQNVFNLLNTTTKKNNSTTCLSQFFFFLFFFFFFSESSQKDSCQAFIQLDMHDFVLSHACMLPKVSWLFLKQFILLSLKTLNFWSITFSEKIW